MRSTPRAAGAPPASRRCRRCARPPHVAARPVRPPSSAAATGRRWRGGRDALVGVRRQEVGGLPRLEHGRDVDHVGHADLGQRAGVDRLAAQGPLVGDEAEARARRGRAAARSANVWCTATTSVSGPIVNRPLSSSSTCAAHSAGAHSARRYSASVAAGHSWRPVVTAARARSRRRSRPGPVAGRRLGVDQPHQAVEIGAVDQLVERRVVELGRAGSTRRSPRQLHTSGHG